MKLEDTRGLVKSQEDGNKKYMEAFVHLQASIQETTREISKLKSGVSSISSIVSSPTDSQSSRGSPNSGSGDEMTQMFYE